MYVCEAYGRYAADLAAGSLDEQVLHHAKRAVVDWYSALIPGAVMPVAQLLERALVEDLDRGEARLALGRQATVRAAALINGTASHAAEVDDIYKHAIYHPGAPTISAALAVAQHQGASGLQFLRAVTAGYEVSTRIGATLGRAHYRHWHNTGTVGTFGAAAAAGVLLGLDAMKMAHALATATTFAAGLQQAFKMDSMSKPLHAGRAAEGGVLAAMGAAQGMTGSLNVLEGEFGMGRAMSDGPDWQAALADLSAFNICQMTFKNHACCGHTFAAIDGALVLQQRHGIRSENIAQVRVSTYGPALAVAGNLNPVTPAEARFSIPFVVATALRYGSVRLAAFSEERLKDADIRALMARIAMDVHPELDAQFPGQRAALVRIDTRDGQTFEYLQPTRKGDPDMALTDDELQGKFDELVQPVLGEVAAARVAQALWRLESLPQLRQLGAG
jgi:2-methylcitrate dehydratase PrpD